MLLDIVVAFWLIPFNAETTLVFRFKPPQENRFKVTPPQFMSFCFIKL